MLLSSGGDISIDGTITTVSGDVLVQAGQDLSQTAAISTMAGDVGLIASRNILQADTGNVTTTTGDVLVSAGGNWTMGGATVIAAGGQDVLGQAGGTITLGVISITNPALNRVALSAGGDILDANGAAVNIQETAAGASTSLSLRAGGRIGATGGVVPAANDNAIDLNVDTVAASAATGIYLREIVAGGDITVENVAAVTVNLDAPQRVDFRSSVTSVTETRTRATLEDLTTTADGAEIQVVVQMGRLTVNQGPVDAAGVTASGNNSQIYLEASGDVIINANITAGTPGVTAVDNTSATPGEEIVIRSVSGSLIVGIANPVTISTDEDTVVGNSTSGTSDQIHLFTGPYSSLNVNAAASQNQVTLNSVAGFAVGDVVAIDDGDSNPQVLKITAIAGNSLTLSGNLTSAYSTTQNALVERISGPVRFGNDVTLRTDGGVANQFYDRVIPGGPGSSFFTWSGVPFVSTVARSGTDYVVTFSVTINSTGEENLHMNIDWRDPTGPRTESRDFLTPGVYSVSHVYTFSDFQAFVDAGNNTFLVDFSVSHNQSIQVFGGTIQQGAGPVIVVPGHVLTTTDNPTTGTNIPIPADQVTDDILSDTDFHYEDGLVEITIPTLFLPPIVPEPPRLAPPAPPVAVPNVVVAVLLNADPVVVVETPFSSFSKQSDDYFQLRDGVTGKPIEGYEHIDDEFGELLLQPARLRQWVTDKHLQDQTDLELWLITRKQTGNGAVTIERPVLKFDIANGRPFPATEPMPETDFKELKLLPMPLDENFNDESSPTPEGSNPPIDLQIPDADSPQKDGDTNRPSTNGQSRLVPADSEHETTESDDVPTVTASSLTSRSILTSVAVAAVLNRSRVTSIAPSKSRQLLSRMLNRQS